MNELTLEPYAVATMDDTTKRRWFHFTPDRLVLFLLIVECLFWLSDRFGWSPWHKGYAALAGAATLGVALLAMLMWFVVALIFRRRFQFTIRSLLLLAVAVALPCSWMTAAMKKAREQQETVLEMATFGWLNRHRGNPRSPGGRRSRARLDRATVAHSLDRPCGSVARKNAVGSAGD